MPKNEKLLSSKNKETLGALYPKDNIESSKIKTYKKEIDKVLKDDRITNIAITAPYGVGKSSVLESYFNLRKKEYPFYVKFVNKLINLINLLKEKIMLGPSMVKEVTDFEFIRISNFFDDFNENDLQQKVIEQLIFSVNPKKFPYSKLKRIKDNTLANSLIRFICFIIFVVSSAHILLKNTEFLTNFNVNMSSLELLDKIALIYLSIYIVIFIFIVGKKLKISTEKSTFSGKGVFGPLELSGTTNNEEDVDLFNMYSEEILYYFRKSNIKIIIFEDLDRFENPNIFQELRELNLNINKRQPKVVFIYSLQDKVFEIKASKPDRKDSVVTPNIILRSKAKFFDYVIPIFPTTSLYNSTNTIKEEIAKYGDIDTKFNDANTFLRGLGFFLKDKRMIILIVSEFHSYLEIKDINNSEMSDKEKSDFLNRLLAIIVYKNFFPSDFEKLSVGKSLLNNIFDTSNIYYNLLLNIKTKDIDEEIKNIDREIKDLKRELIIETNEIVQYYFRKILNEKKDHKSDATSILLKEKNYTESDATPFFKILIDSPEDIEMSILNSPYYGNSNFKKSELTIPESIKVLVNSEPSNLSILLDELAQSKSEINIKYEQIKNDTYSMLLGDVLSELSNYPDRLDGYEKIIENIAKNDIKRFLIFNNYISNDFYSYISPVHYGENIEDSLFVESVLSNKKIEDTQVRDLKSTVQELMSSGANFKYAYSSSLLSYLMRINNSYQTNYDLIFDEMVLRKDINFSKMLFSSLIDYEDDLRTTLSLFYKKSPKMLFLTMKEMSKLKCEYVFNQIVEIDLESDKNTEANLIINMIINDVNLQVGLQDCLIKNENILKKYNETLQISSLKNIFNFNIEENNHYYLKIVVKLGIYKSSFENFISIANIEGFQYNFESYNTYFDDINIEKLNVNQFFMFFDSDYDFFRETYTSFIKRINSQLGGNQLYIDLGYSVEESDLISIKKELLESYSLIRISDEIKYEFNEEVLNLLDIDLLIEEKQIEQEIVERLLECNRLHYSKSLFNYVIANDLDVVTYLKNLYEINGLMREELEYVSEKLQDTDLIRYGAFISNNIDFHYAFDYLPMSTETWRNSISLIDGDLLARYIKRLLSIKTINSQRILLAISDSEDKAFFLQDILLNYPKQMSLSDLEIDLGVSSQQNILNIEASRTEHVISAKIPIEIYKLLDEHSVIKLIEDKGKFIMKVKNKEFFK